MVLQNRAFLTNKQKVLLGVIDELQRQKRYSRTIMIKNLFLLKNEAGLDKLIKFYDFFPYKYGPFSHEAYQDMAVLKRNGFLDDAEHVTAEGQSILCTLDTGFGSKIKQTASRFKSQKEIIPYVYEKYKKYAARSELVNHITDPAEPGIFTIGYEGRNIDQFLGVLVNNGIELLVDVRNNPFSMKFSFVKGNLIDALRFPNIEETSKLANVMYLHIPELGIVGSKRKNLETDEDYEKLFVGYKEHILTHFMNVIDKIIKLGKQKRIALMCFEKDEKHCHRGVLSAILQKQGIEVRSI